MKHSGTWRHLAIFSVICFGLWVSACQKRFFSSPSKPSEAATHKLSGKTFTRTGSCQDPETKKPVSCEGAIEFFPDIDATASYLTPGGEENKIMNYRVEGNKVILKEETTEPNPTVVTLDLMEGGDTLRSESGETWQEATP